MTYNASPEATNEQGFRGCAAPKVRSRAAPEVVSLRRRFDKVSAKFGESLSVERYRWRARLDAVIDVLALAPAREPRQVRGVRLPEGAFGALIDLV
jgi:hypothetical protein